jgi:hypothetical protein
VLWGVCLLGVTFIFFVGSVYAILISDHIPYTGAHIAGDFPTAMLSASCCINGRRREMETQFAPCGPAGSWLFDSIKDDHYYCYLVPLTIPVTTIAGAHVP